MGFGKTHIEVMTHTVFNLIKSSVFRLSKRNVHFFSKANKEATAELMAVYSGLQKLWCPHSAIIPLEAISSYNGQEET